MIQVVQMRRKTAPNSAVARPAEIEQWHISKFVLQAIICSVPPILDHKTLHVCRR